MIHLILKLIIDFKAQKNGLSNWAWEKKKKLIQVRMQNIQLKTEKMNIEFRIEERILFN